MCALPLLVVACTEPSPPPLRIGTNAWIGYAPLFLARDRGYFGDAPIHLVEHSTNYQSVRALRNGAIEAAALTLDEALLVAESLPDVRIVLVLDVSLGADALLARDGIEELADLRGRRIGVESTGVGAYLLARALETAGLRRTDLEVVLLPVDEHWRAFVDGEVDAVVTFDPVRRKLLEHGARPLFHSGRIPGEIVDVLVVRESYLRRHPDVLGGLLQGWFRAVSDLAADPVGAAGALAPRTGLDTEKVLETLQALEFEGAAENRRLLAGDTPALAPVVERLTAVMRERRLLGPTPLPPDLIEPQPLLRLGV